MKKKKSIVTILMLLVFMMLQADLVKVLEEKILNISEEVSPNKDLIKNLETPLSIGKEYPFIEIKKINNYEILNLYIASSIHPKEYGGVRHLGSLENKMISFSEECTLGAVLEIFDNEKKEKIFISDFSKIKTKTGKEIDAKLPIMLNNYRNITLEWFKVENDSKNRFYNNVKGGVWNWDKIKYKNTPMNTISPIIELITTRRIPWSTRMNVAPTILDPIIIEQTPVGTMRYKLKMTIDGKTYETPGAESEIKRYGISEDVHRISLKGNTDNEVINYAFAMCNLPYIWGSASFTGDQYDNHQAELFIGADCADFCVAAHQMAGKQLPYDSIKYLSHTKIIAEHNSTANGDYLDFRNNPITIGNNGVQVADFVYWGTAHVGLFYADKSDPDGQFTGKADGVLNQWDLVLHTLYAEPKIERIIDITNYGNLTIYRYKE